MSEPVDPVPLGQVYGHKDGPTPYERLKVDALIETITNEFDIGRLAVYGRRGAGLERERVWPADHEIDWAGKPTDTDDYCSVCAFRRGLSNSTGPRRQAVIDDVFEDLAIERADWNRIQRVVDDRFAGDSLRASIENALEWPPINGGIDELAHTAGIEPEAAWDIIKEAISLGTLPAQCLDDRGERTPLEPHWIALLAPFQLPGDPHVADLPIGALPDLVQSTNFPEAGILWFDRRRAAENRLARNIAADHRPERSLPPTRVRNVVVNRAAMERLIAVVAPKQQQPSRGSVWTGSSPTPHRFDNPAWELGDVYGWVIDRDRSQFGRISTFDDWRSTRYIAALYAGHEHEAGAGTVLLHALQRGNLIARDRTGRRVSADCWLAKAERDLPALSREFLFRRDEVLEIWPNPENEPFTVKATGSDEKTRGYIPRWISFDTSVNHVHAVQRGLREDAQELLLKAMRDGDVQSRNADTGQPIEPRTWFAAARNPVHIPAFIRIEVYRDDLLQCWPGASESNAPETTASAAYTMAPGPKGGETSVKQLIWKIAAEILESEAKPKPGHGRLAALARMVSRRLKDLGHCRQDETIIKSLRQSFREWESKNPNQ